MLDLEIYFNGHLNFPNTVHLTFISKATDVFNAGSGEDVIEKQRSYSLFNT